jgi:hypothetical protein
MERYFSGVIVVWLEWKSGLSLSLYRYTSIINSVSWMMRRVVRREHTSHSQSRENNGQHLRQTDATFVHSLSPWNMKFLRMLWGFLVTGTGWVGLAEERERESGCCRGSNDVCKEIFHHPSRPSLGRKRENEWSQVGAIKNSKNILFLSMGDRREEGESWCVSSSSSSDARLLMTSTLFH